MSRTPAQYRGDMKRSHRAKAKREQKSAATLSRIVRVNPHLTGLNDATAMTYRQARMHLNFLLTATFEDFTDE